MLLFFDFMLKISVLKNKNVGGEHNLELVAGSLLENGEHRMQTAPSHRINGTLSYISVY